jgi:hypothetical protein
VKAAWTPVLLALPLSRLSVRARAVVRHLVNEIPV